MKLLAISGSARRDSTNTMLLRMLRQMAPDDLDIDIYTGLAALPVFSQDREGDAAPPQVRALIKAITAADGVIISCPEYVRTLPGGLKNAIDWLVSGNAIIHKPVVLAHASHRGDDMLATLRIVLETISSRFGAHPFIRFALVSKTNDEIRETLTLPENAKLIAAYLSDVQAFVAGQS
jgi:chromate reductase, NAD(P)H dehydrogenase (quinone)